jgi:hypothetical protein
MSHPSFWKSLKSVGGHIKKIMFHWPYQILLVVHAFLISTTLCRNYYYFFQHQILVFIMVELHAFRYSSISIWLCFFIKHTTGGMSITKNKRLAMYKINY